MLLKFAIALLGMFLVSAEPTAPQSREVARSDDLKVTVSKLTGSNEIEVIQVDLGDYRLLYYIRPVWEAGSVQGKNGKRVPVEMEVIFVLRFDERTGAIERWDEQLGSAAASRDVDCASNGCGGVCCGFDIEAEASTSEGGKGCVICTCCANDKPKDCGVVLNTCSSEE